MFEIFFGSAPIVEPIFRLFQKTVVHLIAALAVFFLSFSQSLALPIVEVVELEAQRTAHQISQFDFLEDPSQKLTLADVVLEDVAPKFNSVPEPAQALNFGYSRSAFWLRLKIKNESDTADESLLQIGKARLTSVQFHYPLLNGRYQSVNTGDMEPFSSRPYPSRFFVLPLTLPAQSEHVIYLRVQSDSAVMIPVKLWTRQDFHEYERADYVGQALYFGLAVGAILFNLLLFAVIRDISLLLYVAFSTSIVFALAAQNGLLAQYLPFHFLLLSRISAPVGFSLTLVAALVFMRHMLQSQLFVRNADVLLKVLVGLNLLMPLGYAVSVPAFAAVGQWLNILTMVVMISVATFCAFNRQRSAYYFVAAFVVLFVSAVIAALAGLGWLAASFFTLNILQLGSAVEMLLMALSVADRFNLIRREKEAAQQTALNSQRQLIANLTDTERVLEERVQARTAELRQFMDMLNHELKTPMAVIRMSMEVKNLSPNAKRNAIQSVSDMDAIIERCLQADKLDFQPRIAQRQACDVTNMLTQMCAVSTSPQRLRLVPTASLIAHTDVQLLHIVLSNLVDNALKYSTPDSLVSIELALHARHNQAGFQIRIANTPGAAGWPDAQQVFAKYYRSPGAQGKSGSGLGLYLVKNMAHVLGGSICYCPTESQVKFELWLPV